MAGHFQQAFLFFALLAPLATVVCAYYNAYQPISAFPAPLSTFPNATQFGSGAALSYDGSVGAVAGIDYTTGTPFVSIFYLLSTGTYQFGQLITGNPIANFSTFDEQFQWGYLPVRFSADATVLVWGWTNYLLPYGITSLTNFTKLGEVYVYYYGKGESYHLAQTLTEPVSSLPTFRMFGSDLVLSSTGQTLVVSAPIYNNSQPSSATLTSRLYTYQLTSGGSSWPPSYANTGYISHTFCTTCYVVTANPGLGDYWGQSIGADATLNTLAVGAPRWKLPASAHNQGAVYLYQLTALNRTSFAYDQIDFIPYNNGTYISQTNFGIAVAVDPSAGQLVVGQSTAPFSADSFYGAAYTLGLSPLTGNHTAGMNYNLLNYTANPTAPFQGAAVSASGHNGKVIAVSAPYFGGNQFSGLSGAIIMWERNSTSPFTYNLTNILRAFSLPTDLKTPLLLGHSVAEVSNDNSTVLAGAPGFLNGTYSPANATTSGFAYFWRNSPYVTVPDAKCNLNVSNAIGAANNYTISCKWNATDGFNLSNYFSAINVSANPCRNQTTGAGTVYSYASFPAGYVTKGGVLYGNGGATCGSSLALVSIYVSCTAAASWDCLPAVPANVTFDPSANDSARPILQTIGNTVFVAEVPVSGAASFLLAAVGSSSFLLLLSLLLTVAIAAP